MTFGSGFTPFARVSSMAGALRNRQAQKNSEKAQQQLPRIRVGVCAMDKKVCIPTALYFGRSISLILWDGHWFVVIFFTTAAPQPAHVAHYAKNSRPDPTRSTKNPELMLCGGCNAVYTHGFVDKRTPAILLDCQRHTEPRARSRREGKCNNTSWFVLSLRNACSALAHHHREHRAISGFL